MPSGSFSNYIYALRGVHIKIEYTINIFPSLKKPPKLYLFIFREKGRDGKRDGEKYQCEKQQFLHGLGIKPTLQASALTGNENGDLAQYRAMPSQLTTLVGATFHFSVK